MIFIFYIPVPSREVGISIAHAVVKESLAACGNVLEGMTSVYEWKGKVCEEGECVLILKTDAEKEAELRERVLELHPYECPCVLSWEAGANPSFLEWVGEQTR